MQALTEVVRAGKARYAGFSEWPVEVISEAIAMKGVVRRSSQPQYSLLWRKPEKEIIPLCKANGISQIVWSPLAQGVLTGKYRPGETPAQGTRGQAARWADFFSGPGWNRAFWKPFRGCGPSPRRRGCRSRSLRSPGCLRIDNVASAIIGATRPAQVEENVRASGHHVDPSLFHEAERILGDVAPA